MVRFGSMVWILEKHHRQRFVPESVSFHKKHFYLLEQLLKIFATEKTMRRWRIFSGQQKLPRQMISFPKWSMAMIRSSNRVEPTYLVDKSNALQLHGLWSDVQICI